MATTINTQQLFEAKAVRFGTSAESTSFQQAFMESLYRTLTEIQNFTGMAVTLVTDVQTDVALDTKYYNAVSSGLDFYLQDTNLFTANPVEDAWQRFQRECSKAQRLYAQSIDTHPRFGTLPESSVATNTEGFVQ
jgi:hypothetical protein